MPARIDEDACVGCGACRTACPTGAIAIDLTARIDPDRCASSGACVDVCPQACIHLPDEERTAANPEPAQPESAAPPASS